MKQDPGFKKFPRVSSKAGRIKNSTCWGASRHTLKTEWAANQLSRPREQCLGCRQHSLWASPKLNVLITFAPISVFSFFLSLSLTVPHHSHIFVPSPLFWSLLSEISRTPRIGSPCHFLPMNLSPYSKLSRFPTRLYLAFIILAEMLGKLSQRPNGTFKKKERENDCYSLHDCLASQGCRHSSEIYCYSQ